MNPHSQSWRDLHPKPRAHWYSAWLRDKPTLAMALLAAGLVAAAWWRMR